MVAAATVWINEGYERWMVVIRRCTCNEAGKTGVNRCKEEKIFIPHKPRSLDSILPSVCISAKR